MGSASVAMWLCGAVLLVGAGYLLHRCLLWAEQEGWICYLHRRPSGGGGGALLEVQKYLEPKIENVQQVKEGRNAERADEGGGLPRQD